MNKTRGFTYTHFQKAAFSSKKTVFKTPYFQKNGFQNPLFWWLLSVGPLFCHFSCGASRGKKVRTFFRVAYWLSPGYFVKSEIWVCRHVPATFIRLASRFCRQSNISCEISWHKLEFTISAALTVVTCRSLDRVSATLYIDWNPHGDKLPSPFLCNVCGSLFILVVKLDLEWWSR